MSISWIRTTIKHILHFCKRDRWTRFYRGYEISTYLKSRSRFSHEHSNLYRPTNNVEICLYILEMSRDIVMWHPMWQYSRNKCISSSDASRHAMHTCILFRLAQFHKLLKFKFWVTRKFYVHEIIWFRDNLNWILIWTLSHVF